MAICGLLLTSCLTLPPYEKVALRQANSTGTCINTISSMAVVIKEREVTWSEEGLQKLKEVLELLNKQHGQALDILKYQQFRPIIGYGDLEKSLDDLEDYLDLCYEIIGDDIGYGQRGEKLK